ncbi:MAG: hypothetical protein WBB01_09830, partial [Phormidesmis sp.]
MKNKIFFSAVGASALVSFGFVATAQAAELKRISSISDFYEAYDASDNYASEANAIIDGLFDYVAPFRGESGLENAAAAGFVPMTKQLKFHGTHWFNPVSYLSSSERSASVPTGLNFDENGSLVAVFWPEEKYDISEETLNQLKSADPASLPALYTELKASTLKPTPEFLQPFGDVNWHSHENVLIENVGDRDSTTGTYTDNVLFKQSLTNENFIGEVLSALNSPDETAAPFEFFSDTTVYPPFDTLATPGFYMTHMWLGLENPAGLFAGTHMLVSPDAAAEHTTFESGSGHGGEQGGGHSPG